jgi:hypothetical protein
VPLVPLARRDLGADRSREPGQRPGERLAARQFAWPWMACSAPRLQMASFGSTATSNVTGSLEQQEKSAHEEKQSASGSGGSPAVRLLPAPHRVERHPREVLLVEHERERRGWRRLGGADGRSDEEREDGGAGE